MNERADLLLIMEVDLEKRYSFFQSQFQLETHVLQLKNSLKLTALETIKSRLTYKKKIILEYQVLKPKLVGLNRLFISNPEGYIAKNIIDFIRKDFPDLKIISLQHGIFALDETSIFKTSIKTLINMISNIFLGYHVVGDGFGVKSTDAYIVYNRMYKEYLLARGWREQEVIVSSYILKGKKHTQLKTGEPANNAIFFLQCLSELGITDKGSELELVTNISQKLARKFDHVFIKQHPYARIDLPNLPENCKEVESTPDMKDLSLIVSAFSTALLDFEEYEIPCVAIKYNKLNVSDSVYDQFLNIHYFDTNIDNEFTYKKNPKRDSLPIFFEVGEVNLENI